MSPTIFASVSIAQYNDAAADHARAYAGYARTAAMFGAESDLCRNSKARLDAANDRLLQAELACHSWDR